MDQLQICIDCIINDSVDFNPESMYQALSEVNVVETENEQLEEIISKLYQLCKERRLSKYYVYLSCMANDNCTLLQKFIEYDKANANLNTLSKLEIFEFVVFKRKHWFLRVLERFESLGKENFDEIVYQKILLAKLIELTNAADIDTEKIEDILNGMFTSDDKFVEFYKTEIKKVLDVTAFMERLNLTENRTGEVLHFLICNSLLSSLSKYVNLQQRDYWTDIDNQLRENDARYFKDAEETAELDIFLSFTIIHTILSVVISPDKDTFARDDLEKAKQNFFKIGSAKLQIEVIKVLFILIFLRNEHLKICADGEEQQGYLNNYSSLSGILQFLKDVFETIKIQKRFNKESAEYKTFMKFNKYLMDAVWRLELVSHVKASKLTILPHRLISYMLAPPESLIYMCLRSKDFERALQVVRIFNLEGDNLAKEVEYSATLANLKDCYKHKQNHNAALEFLQQESPLHEDTVCVPLCLQKANDCFTNMFDFAITQCSGFDDSEIILKEAYRNCIFDERDDFNYAVFCNKFKQVFEHVGKREKTSARSVLIASNFKLDVTEYQKEEEFFEQLDTLYNKFEDDLINDKNGSLNSSHEAHTTYSKLREICERYNTDTSSTCYLTKLFTYLKAFSKVLYIQENHSAIVAKDEKCSLFEILKHNRALLVGKLLFENNLDPADFEDTFVKLKLDLLYHIAGNCFPTINLHKQEIVSSEELYPENRLYVPTNSIMTYIQKRNWLLAYILSEMYKVHALNVEINRTRIRHLENYMNLARIQNLKVLFEESEIITALQNEVDSDKLIDFIQKRMESATTANMTSSHASEDSVENAEEMSEEHMKAIDWKYLFDIVDSIPESQLKKSEDYLNLRDLIVKSMVCELYEFKYHEYVQYICNGQLRIETILGSFDSWPINFCSRILTAELYKLEKGNFDQRILKTWIEKLELYKLIMGIMGEESWYEVHKICHEKPAEIVKLIIGTKNIDTLHLFLTVFGPTIDNLEEYIDAAFIAELIQLDEPFSKIEKVLNIIPTPISAEICFNLLKQLKSIPQHQNVVEYLLKITDSENDVLKNVQISLKIFSSLSHEELDQFWCLITSPLNILEMLVMNTKLDKLGVALESIRDDLKKHENDDSVISVHDVDEMLRDYAEKSLDFRVVLLPSQQLAKNGDMKLLESFDSANAGPELKKFVMPSKVPSKENWVSNNEIIICMCCSETSFSMFNRRHHCRRCGRVVCNSCSQKRMLVKSYGDILVRVCDNCFEQTQQSASTSRSETVSSKSVITDYWLLTDNEEHNKIVREEFSYEYAPSISLCLAILKHHSKTNKYPHFLLKQCEGMLKLLHPRSQATHEIDHLLVIRMLKSLALAAKMSCSECMLHWGISLADKILSQADVLNLLIERGCLGLLPVSNQSEITFIDTTVLRRLRDKLLEDEQWNLALEVSTKTGLDNTGVFAAWGKCCLKSGSLQLAREKFQRCFSKTPFDASSELEASTSTGRRYKHTSSSSGENRSKDPPLLQEIIQILETKTTPINKKVLRKLETKNLTASTFSLNQSVGFTGPFDPAICILNKLKNLDAIAAGNYYEVDETEENKLPYKPRIQPLFYDECIFYLQKYGSPSSLLRFFVKHGDFRKAVRYILDTKVTPEVFSEIYTVCLQEGVVDELHTCMREIDPSLDIWKDYVQYVCYALEKQHKLHSLYQLQLFIGDCIRAALACIYFYKENTGSFLELVHRNHYLQQAEVHLNQNLEQQQWVEVAAVSHSVGSMESYEEKSITNPSLVMKISSKDIGRHINTVWRQMEVTNFLAGCEVSGRLSAEFINEFLFTEEGEERTLRLRDMPTLFDSAEERSRLVVLVLIGGESVDDGFGLAQNLIPEFRLKPMKIYCMAGKQLAKLQKYDGIAELVTCIRSSSTDEKVVNEMCDEMLLFAVRALTNANAPGSELEKLIKLINDKGEKISAYIEAKQLKSAYFIAVKNKRMADVRRIMREAELLNQPSIKALCQKFIQSNSHPSTSQ